MDEVVVAFDFGEKRIGVAVGNTLIKSANPHCIIRSERKDLRWQGVEKVIRVTLKYGKDKNEKIITGLKRISKPGLRIYANSEEMPKVLGGLGIAIVSTNKGVITDKEARKLGVGGEVLAFVW